MALTTISNGHLEATIDSAGAQLMNLKLDGAEYLWQRDPAFWPRCAPVLFPIVGTLRNDFATSEQGEVRLARHGLARTYEHEIVEALEDSVTYQLVSTDETRAVFPYDFQLNMTYRIVDGTLEQEFAVTNTGEVTLPFAVGGHPAFNVPAPGCEAEDFSDYRLVFERTWSCSSPTIDATTGLMDYATATKVIDEASELPISHELFANDAITLQDVPGRTIKLVGPSGHGIQVDFPGFDFIGIWSAPNAPFVALEPWRGTATRTDEDDVFEHKQGMDFLDPGEQAVYAFRMKPL